MGFVVASTAAVVGALVAIALLVRHHAALAGLDAIAPLRGLARLLRRVSIDQWRAIDAETEREPGEAGRASVQVLVVLLTIAAALTLQEYLGGHDTYERLFPPDKSYYWELRGYAWWSGWRVFGYVIVPMLVLACLPGQRIRDHHLSLRG